MITIGYFRVCEWTFVNVILLLLIQTLTNNLVYIMFPSVKNITNKNIYPITSTK